MLVDFAELRHARIRKIIRGKKPSGVLLDAGSGKKPFEIANFDITHLDLKEQRCYKHKFIKADLLKYETEKKYDVIVCLEVLEHLSYKQVKLAVKKLKSMLADDGILIVSIPNIDGIIGQFVKLSWLIRVHTTEKEYLHQMNHHDLSPKQLISILREDNREDNREDYKKPSGVLFMFYDCILSISSSSALAQLNRQSSHKNK